MSDFNRYAARDKLYLEPENAITVRFPIQKVMACNVGVLKDVAAEVKPIEVPYLSMEIHRAYSHKAAMVSGLREPVALLYDGEALVGIFRRQRLVEILAALDEADARD